jgi:hypothetical protein
MNADSNLTTDEPMAQMRRIAWAPTKKPKALVRPPWLPKSHVVGKPQSFVKSAKSVVRFWLGFSDNGDVGDSHALVCS